MLMSEVVDKPAESPNTEPRRARGRSVRGVWRRAGDSGLCHGQVFALGAFHEGVVAGDQPAEGGEISQHFLLPVRPSLHRRPGAHRAGDRAALHSRGHRGGRRAALGRSGTLHPLSGFQEERLLRSGFWRRSCGGRRPARRSVSEGVVSENRRLALLRIRIAVGKYVPLSGWHHAQAARK